MGISRSCTRRLINSEEELTFNMTRHSRCGHLYDVTIKRSNRVIFKMAMKAQTRVSFTFGETDQQLHGTPVRWYITLKVHTVKNSSHAKVLVILSNFCYSFEYCLNVVQCLKPLRNLVPMQALICNLQKVSGIWRFTVHALQ